MTTAKTNKTDAANGSEAAMQEALSADDLTKKEQRELEEQQRAIDEARGYKRRVLANGLVDFEALHDHWTSPSEQSMQEHVAGYQAKTSNFLSEPTIIITNQ